MMRCCFDKRVWIGLGVVAVGLLVVDPRAGWGALPVLAVLACPVSMLFMMRGMRQGTGSATAAPGGESAGGARTAQGDRAAEIARLRREIGQLRAQAGDVTPAAAGADQVGARDAAGTADPAGRGRPVIGR